MTELTSLELWRLADTLSVVDAAILISGGDPSDFYFDEEDVRHQKTWQHKGYEAVYAALRGAILSNKLKANVRHSMRRGVTRLDPYDEPYDAGSLDGEEQFTYDMLVARIDTSRRGKPAEIPGQTKLNFSVDDLRGERFLHVIKEPNWKETTVDVDDLTDWLEKRGVLPHFFFPAGDKDSLRNESNPRYSAKLSCAIAAWEAVKQPARNKSVKQTLQDWVQSNGVKFGLGENGIVSQTAAEEIAKIANWNTKGGANPTYSDAVEEKGDTDAEVDNYAHGYRVHLDDDPDIPF